MQIRARFLHVAPSLSIASRARIALCALRTLPGYLGLVLTRMPGSRLHVEALEIDVGGKPTIVPRTVGQNSSGALLFFWEILAGDALPDVAEAERRDVARELPEAMRSSLLALTKTSTVKDVIACVAPHEDEHLPERPLLAALERVRESTRLFSDGVVTPVAPPPSKSTIPAPAGASSIPPVGSLAAPRAPSIEMPGADTPRESAPPRESLVRPIINPFGGKRRTVKSG